MEFGKKILYQIIILLMVINNPIYVRAATEYNFTINPSTFEFGMVDKEIIISDSYKIINNNLIDPLNFTIETITTDVSIEIVNNIIVNPGEEKNLIFKITTPKEGGKYEIRVKIYPYTSDTSSGSKATPAFEGVIRFTVMNLGIHNFVINSGSDIIGFLSIINLSYVSLNYSGKIDIIKNGNIFDTIDLGRSSINAYDNKSKTYGHKSWELDINIEDEGIFVGEVTIYIENSISSKISKSYEFIVGSAIPVIKITMKNEGEYPIVELIASNNGLLSYLVEFSVIIEEFDSSTLVSNDFRAIIVRNYYNFTQKIIMESLGKFIVKIKGTALNQNFYEEMIIDSKGNTDTKSELVDVIGNNVNKIPSWIIFISIGLNLIIIVLFLIRKSKKPENRSKPKNKNEPRINRIHIFLEEGEGLATYDHKNKILDEMEMENITMIMESINLVNLDLMDYLPIDIDVNTTYYLHMRDGLGIAFELYSEKEYEKLRNSSSIREQLDLFIGIHGMNLRRGLVDLKIADLDIFF